MDPTLSCNSYSHGAQVGCEGSGFDLFAIFLAYMGIMIFMMIACYVISSWMLSRIFKKAGIEEWKAWVPFYNTWIMLEMGEQKGWYLLLSLIPFVGPIIFLVFSIMAQYEIGKKFGKEGTFVLWAIFLSPVWYAILAFDKSTWSGPRQPAMATPAAAPQYMAPEQPATPPTDTNNKQTPQI